MNTQTSLNRPCLVNHCLVPAYFVNANTDPPLIPTVVHRSRSVHIHVVPSMSQVTLDVSNTSDLSKILTANIYSGAN